MAKKSQCVTYATHKALSLLHGPVCRLKFRSRGVAAAVVVATFLVGCASELAVVEKDFGTANRIMLTEQTINPKAPSNNDAAVGLDGIKAVSSFTSSYRKSEASKKELRQPIEISFK